MRRLPGTLVCGLVMLAATAPGLLAQETGTVTGTVSDVATGRPLSGVQVHVPGTAVSAVTRADGRYLLTNAAAGEIRVRARLIGYAAAEQPVLVTAGETAMLDLQLAAQAIALGEVVVTGTAGETERRAMGNVVSSINAAAITERTHINSLDELLQHRVPGMMVYPPSGTHGVGQVMQIRGVTSVSLASDPVVYIDGVRVDASHDRDGVWLGGQHTSRIQDLQPQDIERVEIVKGAAAATLYGTQGSNGVIQIFTRRGSAGAPQWALEIGQGLERMRTDTFPGRLFSEFVGPDGFRALDPIREVKSGHHQRYNLSVAGGTEQLRYYFSSGFRRGEASIRPESNWESQFSGRANVDALLSPTLTLSATSAISSSNARIPRGENAWESIYQSFAAGIPYTATENRPYGEPGGSVDAHVTMEHMQGTRRATTGLTLDHAPGDRFRQRATVGMDWYTEETTTLFPFGYEGMFYPQGNKHNHTRQFRDITTDYRATFTQPVSPAVTFRLSAGAQGNFTETIRVEGFGDQFPGPGLETISAAASTQAWEFRVEEVNAGVFVDQITELWDRVFLGAGLRLDGNSAFGDEFRYQMYPKVSLAYNISDEAFWPGHLVPTMKLRTAYGTAGRAPAQFAADRTYTPIAGKMGQPAVTPWNIGDPNLGPETSHEFELGFDAGLWANRVGLELTYWNQRTVDALMRVFFPPSQGFLRSQFVNLGEVRNRGVELLANALVLRRPGLEWDVNVQAAHQTNELTDMGGLPPQDLRTTRLNEGFPVNGIWTYELEWDPDERTHMWSDSMVYVGPADPVWTGGVGSDLRWNRLTLSGTLGFAAGHHRVNFQQWWDTYSGTGDLYLSLVERPDGTPTAASDSLWDYTVNGGYNIFNHRADFLRVRELAVGYELPDAWFGRFGMARSSIRLSARNLWIWTRWPGMDPEVGTYGAEHVGRGMDWNSTPMPRLFMLSFRTSF
jgi:TonB-dependent starch-binding outer membrane protein SusC